MGKIINFIKLSAKGTPIGLLSGATDAVTMYILGRYTEVDLKFRVFISSILGMLVSFIGNHLWTFRHRKKGSITRKFTIFMVNHLLLTIIHGQIVIYVINLINKSIEDNTQTTIFTEKDKDNKIILTTITEIMVKQCLAGIFYLINIFIMQFIF